MYDVDDKCDDVKDENIITYVDIQIQDPLAIIQLKRPSETYWSTVQNYNNKEHVHTICINRD